MKINQNCKNILHLIAIFISKQLLSSLFIIIIPRVLLGCFVQRCYRADTCCDASILINSLSLVPGSACFFSCGCSCCCFPLVLLFKLEKGKPQKKAIKEFCSHFVESYLIVSVLDLVVGQSCRPKCERDVGTFLLRKWFFMIQIKIMSTEKL